MRKLTLPAACLTSAAVAFGLGVAAQNDTAAPPLSVPRVTSSPAPQATPQDAREAATPDAVQVADATSPETAAQRTTAPAKPSAKPQRDDELKPVAKPSAKPKAGSAGPFKDAEGDGKVLDDMGRTLMPNTPVSLPNVLLPFPGRGDGLPSPATDADTFGPVMDEEPPAYPYDPNWGDAPEDAADPGVVCDPELAANLGVPVGDCAAEPNHVDTWYPVTD